jgi:hypothetical protein
VLKRFLLRILNFRALSVVEREGGSLVATEEQRKLLMEFEMQFPSEAACVSFVQQLLRETDGLSCHHCTSCEVEHLQGRTIRCIACGKMSWFTAKTAFERAKKIKPFLALLWFQENGLPLSSSRARELLGIAQSSAWEMLKKIDLICSKNKQDGLDISVSSEAFRTAIIKRSKETHAREHPHSEIKSFGVSADGAVPRDQNSIGNLPWMEMLGVETIDQDAQGLSSKPLQPSSTQERVIQILMQEDSSLHIDRISELTAIPMSELLLHLTYLELDGLIVTQVAGKYSLNRSQVAYLKARNESRTTVPIEDIREGVARFTAFCREHFHGTSRKYLQLYLFRFRQVIHKARRSWTEAVATVLQHEPIPANVITHYVSPQSVQLLVKP